MAEPRKKILVVEDEPNLAFNLQLNLKAEGYDVVLAADGQSALDRFGDAGPFDLVILDVMLPELSGIEVAKTIRGKDDQTHILMLTALGKEDDRLRGFEAGVDDYITKPFHLKELLMRVKRMVQRAKYFQSPAEPTVESPILKFGPFELNTELLQLKAPGGGFTLTAMEADVLKEFMQNPKRVLSREHLLDAVWGMKGDIETRTVDNFIVRLRRYLEADPTDPKYLLSVRGRGYRLVDGV